MSDSPAGELTLLLRAAANGDQAAEERLFALAYDQLRRIARSALRRESATTLEPTALVHEAYLRLGNRHEIHWADRRHFYGVAARAMRRVLVDRARARGRLKRGPLPVTLPEGLAAPANGEDVVLAVDEALRALEAVDPRRARVVELRWFAGLDVDEVAQFLEVGTATVKRDWAAAKAWLMHRLANEVGPDPSHHDPAH